MLSQSAGPVVKSRFLGSAHSEPSAFAKVRQWPKVYDLCHTFLHVARVKKPCDSRMAVGFSTRATCKNVLQNLIPRATAYCKLAITGNY